MAGWLAPHAAAAVAAATCLGLSVASGGAAAPMPARDSGTAVAVSGAAPLAPSATESLPFSDREVAKLLGSARDDVSFSVRDRTTGQTYTYNGDLRNSTGSIVKVLVLFTLIRERREDGKSLSTSQKRLAERMIRFSDNDATTSLLRQAGGRWALQRMAKDLGMSRTTMSGSWGRSTTSAADQRLLIDKLVDGTPHLSKSDRAYILGLMGRVTPEQRWGVGKVPAGNSVAVKNGWVPLSPRGWRVNSIGSVKGSGRDYTLAILSYDNASMNVGVERNRRISDLVWRKLGRNAGAAGFAATGSGASPAEVLTWIKPGAAVPPRPLL